ncbi:DNA polymerase III subunit delta [Armatimonadota bacterium]|nr:DNA polymerase III subunit delta [Armatimonadota bacterium]
MELEYKSGSPALLWKEGLQRVYLFFGSEDRLKHEAADALIKQVVSSDFADFDLEVMDVLSVGADAILASAAQVPFGSDYRMVVVRGLEQWRERGKSAEAERLAEGLARMGGSTCLVLIASAEEEDDKRKVAVTVKLDNAVKKLGAVVKFSALKGEGLSKWVSQRVREEGKQIEPDAVNLLLGSAGHELLTLEQEILKLVCWVGEHPTITAKDVGTVTASSPEDVVFKLIDSITRKETDNALQLLAEVHRYDPKPQAVAGKLLALLSRQYRMLWQAKFLDSKRIAPRDVRSLPPDIASELPSEGNIAQIAFRAGDLFQLARNYSWGDLTQVMEWLLLCDLANKGNVLEAVGVFGTDPLGNLQLLVLLLTGTTEHKGQRRTA